MKKLNLKQIDKNHYVAIALTLIFIAISLTIYINSYIRIWESLKDFRKSCVYTFCGLFDIENGTPATVNNLSGIKSYNHTFLPDNWNEFKIIVVNFFTALFNWENFKRYLGSMGGTVTVIAQIFVFGLLFMVLFKVLFERFFFKENTDHGKQSKPLKIYKRITATTVVPAKKWFKSFYGFIKDGRLYRYIWITLTLISFNAITIIVEFLAYYFYFVESFDLINLYIQLYKLLIDLNHFFELSLFLKIVVAYFVFKFILNKIALKKLRDNEEHNEAFLREQPLLTMIVGTTGSKKTTCITDMNLTQEVIFRKNSLDNLILQSTKFINFPWSLFEQDLKNAMERLHIINLTTSKAWINKKRARFNKNPSSDKLWGYDYNRYGIEFDDELKVKDLFDILEIYVQDYFVYCVQGSYLVSNYAIRTDQVLDDIGNLPMYDTDFFERPASEQIFNSHYSKIIDFDMFRLGKLMIENNKKANCFEFGIESETEIGKERGNQVENAGLKKSAEEANQKNDCFNIDKKCRRHSATIDNIPYYKWVCDEQRPSSLGADARELVDIVKIKRKAKDKNALPLFIFVEFVNDTLIKKCEDIYKKLRYCRGDSTLLTYLFSNIFSILKQWYQRKVNKYGYFVLELSLKEASGDDDEHIVEKSKYYLARKKIYADRFRTDCYKTFYDEKSKNSNIGFNQLENYTSTTMSKKQMIKQNSYWMNNLYIDAYERILKNEYNQNNKTQPPKNNNA